MNGETINLSALAGTMEDSFKKLRAEPQKAELVADGIPAHHVGCPHLCLLCEEAAWTYGTQTRWHELLVFVPTTPGSGQVNLPRRLFSRHLATSFQSYCAGRVHSPSSRQQSRVRPVKAARW